MHIDSKLEYHSSPLHDTVLSCKGKYYLNTGLIYKMLDIQSSTCTPALK